MGKQAQRRGVRRFVVAGGETSGAVVQALDVKLLRIGAQIDPGVPWTESLQGFALALKSGNFGRDDFFTKRLLNRLDRIGIRCGIHQKPWRTRDAFTRVLKQTLLKQLLKTCCEVMQPVLFGLLVLGKRQGRKLETKITALP
ncbi:MAG: hypothetical protein EBX65_04185 [Betaproteobacteria bacterium]|nr:hypothetical protein [Betaproteobacteria bacterium]